MAMTDDELQAAIDRKNHLIHAFHVMIADLNRELVELQEELEHLLVQQARREVAE